MIAVLAGLGAAVAFATATLCSSRSTRMIGPWAVLAWVMLVGLAITAPAAAVSGSPDASASDVAWLALSAVGNVTGLLLAYTALRIGKVGIVAPIVSTEGAIAAVIAVVAGEQVSAGAGATLVLIAVGILLAAVARDEQPLEEQRVGRSAAFALAAAFAFGASLYATGRLSDDLALAWLLLPARLLGVLAIGVPLVLSSRLRLTRRAVPLVVVAGACEIAGFGLFAVGARHGIAVSAVLASQFAAVAAVAAYLLFRERLGRVQVVGVAAIAIGVAVLAGLQA
jgi:drug/metabolite transporter (DMT)-like permease